MKKVFLALAMVFATGSLVSAHNSLEKNQNLNKKFKTYEKSHAICKATGISAAYTVAEILGEAPDVGVFMSVYKRCMGY